MRRETLFAAAAFGLIPIVIGTAAIAATWALSDGASEWLRLPFRLLCHGMARRCLELWGTAMPICARCTGIYAGLFAGLGAFFLYPAMSERVLRRAMLVAVGLLGIDGVTQLLRLRESTNDLRIATGVTAGAAFGLWVLSAIERRTDRGFSSP